MKETSAKYPKYNPDLSLEKLINVCIPVPKDRIEDHIPQIGRKIVFGGCGDINCPYCVWER